MHIETTYKDYKNYINSYYQNKDENLIKSKLDKISEIQQKFLGSIEEDFTNRELIEMISDSKTSSLFINLTFIAACNTGNKDLILFIRRNGKLNGHTLNYALTQAIEQKNFWLVDTILNDIRTNPFTNNFSILFSIMPKSAKVDAYIAEKRNYLFYPKDQPLYGLDIELKCESKSQEQAIVNFIDKTIYIFAETLYRKNSQNSSEAINFFDLLSAFKESLESNVTFNWYTKAHIGYLLEQIRDRSDISIDLLDNAIKYLKDDYLRCVPKDDNIEIVEATITKLENYKKSLTSNSTL